MMASHNTYRLLFTGEVNKMFLKEVSYAQQLFNYNSKNCNIVNYCYNLK